MAQDPKKKRHESAKEKVKRQQAARKRTRRPKGTGGGEFISGPSKLSSVFHKTVLSHASYKKNIRTWKHEDEPETRGEYGVIQDPSGKKTVVDKDQQLLFSEEGKATKGKLSGAKRGKVEERRQKRQQEWQKEQAASKKIGKDSKAEIKGKNVGPPTGKAGDASKPVDPEAQKKVVRKRTESRMRTNEKLKAQAGGGGTRRTKPRGRVTSDDPDSGNNPMYWVGAGQHEAGQEIPERRRGAGQAHYPGTAQPQAEHQAEPVGEPRENNAGSDRGHVPIDANADAEATQRSIFEEHLNMLMNTEGVVEKDARRIAHRTSAQVMDSRFGGHVDPSELERIMTDKVPIRTEDADALSRRINEDELWRSHRGTRQGKPKPDPESPMEFARGKKREGSEAIYSALPESQRMWLEGQFMDPTSPFHQANQARGNPDSKRNLEDYLAGVEDNFSSNEIMMWMQQGKPETVRTKAAHRTPLGNTEDLMADAYEDLENRRHPNASSYNKDKYAGGKGSHSTFAYSMQSAGVDNMESLRKRFPDASDFDLIRYQKAQRETVEQHMLQANERWAHETRQARVSGKGKSNIDSDDRVVFLTTNAGAPTASVPANSTIGQYIIKKRKRYVVDEKLATRAQVKGEFPKAVRDQHIIEISTGISLGIEGRVGAFHNTGWRKGNKRSKGFGKRAPVGAQVLREASGQPVYDKDGNVRYTEGYTRPFAVGSDRDVGLRVFIG